MFLIRKKRLFLPTAPERLEPQLFGFVASALHSLTSSWAAVKELNLSYHIMGIW